MPRPATPTRPLNAWRRQRRIAAHRHAVADHVAAQLHAITGWDLSHLLKQTLADTCPRHGTFCCRHCFS